LFSVIGGALFEYTDFRLLRCLLDVAALILVEHSSSTLIPRTSCLFDVVLGYWWS